MSTLGILSQEDVQKLMTDHSVKAQMDIVEKLVTHYCATEGNAKLDDQQRAIVNDIFHAMLTRTEVTVRALLSMQLSQAEDLPYGLAKQMASDVTEVAGPVLQYSEVLNESDLIEIINSMTDAGKLEFIAKRDTISETLSDALVETKVDGVIDALIKNEGANIKENTFDKITKSYRDNANIMEAVFERNNIPSAFAGRMGEHLSVAVRQHLEKKYGDLAKLQAQRKALESSLELASMKIREFQSSDPKMAEIINALKETGTLVPLSALCLCNLQLFEISLSRLLRIPLSNIHLLLSDARGFNTVYNRAKFPPNLFDAIRLTAQAIEISIEKSVPKKEVPDSNYVMGQLQILSKKEPIIGLDFIYAMMQYCKNM